MSDKKKSSKKSKSDPIADIPKTAPTADSRTPKEIIRKVILTAPYPLEEWEALCELVASDSESESDSGSKDDCADDESGSDGSESEEEDDFVEITLNKKVYHVYWLWDKLFVKKPKDDVLLGSLEYYKPTKSILVVSLDKSGATF